MSGGANEFRFNGAMLAAQLVFAVALAVMLGAIGLKGPITPDFFMLWAAHRTATPYDHVALSRVLHSRGYYFPYAPPFLILTLPLKLLPLHVGYISWLSLSAAAITASLRRPAAPFVLLVPAVVLAGGIGQTSLLMAAALYAGASLRDRPIVSGVLLGLAGVVKPQVVVLLPVVLIAARQWRMILTAVATGMLLSLLATVVWGWTIWADWLRSLPDYVAANDAAWSHRYLSLPGWWKVLALAVGAIASGWEARAQRLERAVFIAVAAALLGSLHAMDYDAAILAPFTVAAALDAGWLGAPFVVAAVLPASSATVAALGGMAMMAILAERRTERSVSVKGRPSSGR